MIHRVTDWLDSHGIDASMVQDVIAAYRSGALADSPLVLNETVQIKTDEVDISDQRGCYFSLVVPTLSSSFSNINQIQTALESVSFQTYPDNEMRIPHTIDAGKGKFPVIVMDWQNKPGDLICLAHEAAHALQIMLSNHMMMPPLARETCAFLGELLLIEKTRKLSPSLFASLQMVWQAENETYLATDLDVLSDALADLETPYHYRQNYPIARLAAVQLFRQGRGAWLHSLFASGCDGMKHLPIAEMANLAGDIENYLPQMPDTDPAFPTLAAYRSLGAMALLDIDYWQGESEEEIKDYYAILLNHLRTHTSFVALNADRKPVGYATWVKPPGDETLTLTRQAAPFGDHLILQRTLEHHLGVADSVAAHHIRSARQEQLAW